MRKDQRQSAIDHSSISTLATHNSTYRVSSLVPFLHQTPNDFWREFRRQLNVLGYLPSEALRQASYTYDAVWAAAFALHNASETLKALPEPQELTDFTYERGDINAYILQAALGLDFRGVSVRLHV